MLHSLRAISLKMLTSSQSEARGEHGAMAQKFSVLESQFTELRSREGQLRSTNKVYPSMGKI
jgi:hypothetical protein